MSKGKTNIEEGEISLEDLNSFSFDVADFNVGEEEELEIQMGGGSEEEEEEEEKKKPKPAEEEEEEEQEEEEQEEEEESEEEEEEEEEEEQPQPADVSYKDLTTAYLEEGIWEDVEIEIEEGKTVKLSEIDNVDKETFFAVQKAQREYSDENLNANYISKDGLSEEAIMIVDILKNGGDFREVFQSPDDLKKPFEGVDLENEQIQEMIVKQQYLRQGLSEKQADELLKIDKADLVLDSKVQQIVNHYQKAWTTNLAKKQQEADAKKQEDAKKLREFKKGVMANLKEGFSLKDTLARKLTNLGVEKNSEGDFKIDEIYAQKMEDPKEAAELLYFLSDKEGYLKMVGAKTKRKTNLNTIKKVSILKDKQKKEGGKKEESKDKSGFEFEVS